MVSPENALFLGTCLFCIPPLCYLINLLLVYGTSTFRSTYYSLHLSRAIVDVSAAIIYLLTTSIREFSWSKDFFWHSQHTYLPTFCYAQIYFFLFAQLISLLFVPVERLVTIFYPPISRLLASGPSCISSILIWIIPLFLAWSTFIQLDAEFDSYDGLHIKVPEENGRIAFLELLIFSIAVFLTFFVVFTVLFFQKSRIRQLDYMDTYFSAIQGLPLFPLLFYLVYSIRNDMVPPRMFASDTSFPLCLIFLSFFNLFLLLIDQKIRLKLFQ